MDARRCRPRPSGIGRGNAAEPFAAGLLAVTVLFGLGSVLLTKKDAHLEARAQRLI